MLKTSVSGIGIELELIFVHSSTLTIQMNTTVLRNPSKWMHLGDYSKTAGDAGELNFASLKTSSWW